MNRLMAIARRTQFLILAIIMLAPASTFAGHSIQVVLDSNSDHFEGYYYRIFALGPFSQESSVILNPQGDSYLIARSPLGAFITSQTYRPDSDYAEGAARIIITSENNEDWIIIATTRLPDIVGHFELTILNNGRPIDARELYAENLPDGLVDSAFRARGVENPLRKQQRKINELVEHLSIKSVQQSLVQTFARENYQLSIRINEVLSILQNFKEQQVEIQSAIDEADLMNISSEVFFEIAMLMSELEGILGRITRAEDRLELARRELEMVVELEGRIKELIAITVLIDEIESRILNPMSVDNIPEYIYDLTSARHHFHIMAVDLAEQLLDKRIVRSSPIGFRLEWATGLHASSRRQTIFSNRWIIEGDRVNIVYTSGEVSDDGGRPLPPMMPWPPPPASARAEIARDLLGTKPESSLGDVADILRGAFNDAGYFGMGFLGAPSGFAMVTPIEQIDFDGTPLAGNARWSTKIAPWKRFSIAGYLRALLTAEPGYFRVIVVIVTDQIVKANSQEATLATIDAWARQGVNALPAAVREQPFTEDHQVNVFLYEFFKFDQQSDPLINIPGQISLLNHLAHTSLAAGLH